ncbi:MAG: adenylate/guanylate cyclase domain-containing protein [Roseiflexaceae bacterium]
MFPQQLLAPYLTPQQATLLRYEEALPEPMVAQLCERLRAELAAIRTLVADPVARGHRLIERHAGGYCPGSLLCADLSGFTGLTEQLATQGRQGVEELSTIINRLFGALLEEITLYGGVVLKFSGDALTVFFDEALVGMQHHALACAAAFVLQQRITAFAHVETSGGPRTLRLRIGVHSGRIFLATLGDNTRCELFVAGADVNRANLAQEHALPGEVLISAETLDGLEHVRSTARPDGFIVLREAPAFANHVVPPPPLTPLHTNDMATALILAKQIATLRPYLPTDLPQRFIDVAHSNAQGEFRPVTVLFIAFSSFSKLLADCEGAESLAVRAVNTYYTRVQNVIHSYGGTINKLDVAGFGERLLALFGAPVAHEDDPQRAIQAALDLRAALQEANREITDLLAAAGRHSLNEDVGLAFSGLDQRIGIATGTVFAGLVGGPDRREYTVIGQTVNLAARLMAIGAPGQTLLGPSAWRAVQSHIALELLPPRLLKGIPEPVSAALALHPIGQAFEPQVAQSLPFVGRSAELATLRARMGAALSGVGSVVTLSGEAGIGKSRLAHEILHDSANASLRSVAVSCQPYATSAPYSLVRDLVLQAFDLPETADPSALRRALQHAVSTYAPALLSLTPLLYSIVAIGHAPAVPESDEYEQHSHAAPEEFQSMQLADDSLARLPPSEQRARLHDLLEALFNGLVSVQPLILVLDDLHWVDASSLEVVQRLTKLAGDKRLLLVLLYRPEAAGAPLWQMVPQVTALTLGPLDQQSSAALLHALLGQEASPDILPILDRAEGSPFFLQALVHHLVDMAELKRDAAGRWVLRRPLDDIGIPSDIERLLMTRLDRLDEQTRALVQVAAVIGTRITYPVLAGVFSQAQHLAQRLTHLVDIGILQIDELDEQAPFCFHPTLLREVAYHSILYSTRRELHHRVAKRMEVLAQWQNITSLAELTYHYLLAEEWERACTYSVQLGRQAQSRYATTEALASYRQAYDLALQHADAIAPTHLYAALEGWADVEVIAGYYDEAHAHYAGFLALIEAQSSPNTDALDKQALLLGKIGNVYEHQGQLDLALEWMQRARALLIPAGQQANLQLARICSDIGWVYFRRGELDPTELWLEQALQLLAQSDHGDSFDTDEQRAVAAERARVQNRLGGVAWARGDLSAARMYVERGLAIWVALGDLLGQTDAQNNLGVLAEQRGDWFEAITQYEGARKIDQQIGRRREAALSLINLGIVYFHQGDLDAALPLLEQAVAQTALVEDTLHEAMALRWQGRALIGKRSWSAARGVLERALALAEAHEWLLECLDAYAALGQLALANAQSTDVETALAAGRALQLQVEHDSFELAYFLRFAAQAARARGDDAQAQSLFDECRTIFIALDMRAEVAFTELLMHSPR